MNLNHQEAVVLVQKLAWTLSDKKHDYAKVEVVVVPPFTDLRSVQTLVDGDRLKIGYGAQDVSEHDSGAYTGEISKSVKLGCSCRHPSAAVPRRDRRGGQRQGQGDRRGMTPIVRVAGSRSGGPPGRVRLEQVGLAHRRAGRRPGRGWPVWAIGTSEVPGDAQKVRAIRGGISAAFSGEVRILYGGSPNATANFMEKAGVDGCLVGARPQPAGFGGICRFYDMPVL
jgi:triosephosphate isomerase